MGKCHFLLFGIVLSALLWGCIYPDIHLTRYDLDKKEGGVTVHFSFVLEGSDATVLPGSITTPAAYGVSVTPVADGSTTQTAYIRTADGTEEAGGISLPAAAAVTVDVRAYSVWADDTAEPLEADGILQKTGIAFTAQDVTGGILPVTLNLLDDAVSTVNGGINLTLAWPAALDFEERTAGVQGITKITAQLLHSDGTDILFPSTLQEITAGSFITDGAQITAAVAATGIPADSYKLRLIFYRGSSAASPVGYFIETVTIWPGSTADTWIDAAGVSHDRRIFTLEELYDAAVSIHSITVLHNNAEVSPATLSSDVDNLIKAGLNGGDTVQFKVKFDEDGPDPSVKTLKSVTYSVNDAAAVELPDSDFLYQIVPGVGSYIASIASFTLPVPSETSTLYKVAVSIQAPGHATGKTYTFLFIAASRGSVWYPTLGGAVAAASGTTNALDEVTVRANTTIKSGNNLTISSGKYIKLTSESGALVLKRAAGNTGSPLITVNGGGQLTLKNIILDGGAVWTGATPPAGEEPSPAFGAANDAGGLTATKPLISLEGAGTKLILSVDSILRNNDNNSDANETTGGAINAWYGPEVIIEGGEVRSNRTYRLGGGIALFGTDAQRTTLKLVNGSINNNDVVQHDGGGISSEGAHIEIQGGFITQNRAHNHGGGIHVWKGAGTPNTLTITGGEITGNTADVSGGGGINAGAGLTATMSGGLISGNSAPSGGGVLIDAGTESGDAVFTMSGDALIK